MCVGDLSEYVYVSLVCLVPAKKSRGSCHSYQNRSFRCFWVTMWVWESDLVLLQETTVLLTMGPSFYSLFLAFLKVLLLKVFFRGDNDEWVRAFPSILMTWVQPSGCPWCEKRTVSRSYTLPLKHTFSSYEHILTLSLNIKIYKCLNFNFYWEFGRFTSILKHCLNFLDNKHLSL